jgi:hypothetical protein
LQYIHGLGFSLLSSFTEHGGFSGSIIGHPNAPYHLEFTTFTGDDEDGHHTPVGRAPTEDNLLVFYIPAKDGWTARIATMRAAGWKQVKSFNPWWDDKGIAFEDVDGYRVVLQNEAWSC